MLAELRHYNIFDSLTERPGGGRSLGIAQIRAETLLNHAKQDPNLLPAGWGVAEVEAALLKPVSAIQLLAIDIKYFATRAPGIKWEIDNWDGLTEARKEHFVDLFTSAKDTDTLDAAMVTGFGKEWGITSYRIIRDKGLLK